MLIIWTSVRVSGLVDDFGAILFIGAFPAMLAVTAPVVGRAFTT